MGQLASVPCAVHIGPFCCVLFCHYVAYPMLEFALMFDFRHAPSKTTSVQRRLVMNACVGVQRRLDVDKLCLPQWSVELDNPQCRVSTVMEPRWRTSAALMWQPFGDAGRLRSYRTSLCVAARSSKSATCQHGTNTNCLACIVCTGLERI